MKYQKPVSRVIPKGRPPLREIREAVDELASLRDEMANRRGARPLSDRQIREAIQEGRPSLTTTQRHQ